MLGAEAGGGDARTWGPAEAGCVAGGQGAGVVQPLAGLRLGWRWDFSLPRWFGCLCGSPGEQNPGVPFPAGIHPFQFETF